MTTYHFTQAEMYLIVSIAYFAGLILPKAFVKLSKNNKKAVIGCIVSIIAIIFLPFFHYFFPSLGLILIDFFWSLSAFFFLAVIIGEVLYE